MNESQPKSTKFPLKFPRGNLVLIAGERYIKTRFGRGLILTGIGVVALVIGISAAWPVQTNLDQNRAALQADIAKLTQIRVKQAITLEKKQQNFEDLQALQQNLKNMRSCILKVNPLLSDTEIQTWIREALQSSDAIELVLNETSRQRMLQAINSQAMTPGAALLLSVGAMESNFRMASRSGRGAIGGMQMMRRTANSLGIEDPTNPEHNLRGGRTYLVSMLEQFQGYEDQLELALAAYNAGPTRVQERWISTWGNRWESIYAGLMQQRSTFAETRYYTHSAVTLAQLFTSGQWTWKDNGFWDSFRSQLKHQTRQAYASANVAAAGS
jgi:soluble lytic murein transglycosylase-like protein